jgi:hypothetical protein
MSTGDTGGASPGDTAGPVECAASPHSCGFPDATNTGVPAGTALTVVPNGLPNCSNPDVADCNAPAGGSLGSGWKWDHRGFIAVTTDGAVVKDVQVAAVIDVKAPNVTVEDTLINCACGYYQVVVRNTDTGAAANADNLTIEDSTLEDTAGASGGQNQINVKEFGGVGGMKILRDNLSGAGGGVQNGNGARADLIRDSYIHDLLDGYGYHDEDVHIDYGGPMTIEHNTLFNEVEQTAVVMINQDGPPAPSHVSVDDNLMAGGGYTIYGGDKGAGYSGPTSYIVITNNHLSPLYFPSIGQYSWISTFTDTNTGNLCSGNVDDSSGEALSC